MKIKVQLDRFWYKEICAENICKKMSKEMVDKLCHDNNQNSVKTSHIAALATQKTNISRH